MTPKNRISSAAQSFLHQRNIALFKKLYQNQFVQNVDKSIPFCQSMSEIFCSYQRNGVSKDFFYHFVSKLMNRFSSESTLFDLLRSYQISTVLPAVAYWYEVKTSNNDVKYWRIDSGLTADGICNSLIIFLFEKYKVPEPLRNIWFCYRYEDDLKLSVTTGFRENTPAHYAYADMVTFHWYFLVADGGVLRKDEFLPFTMSKNAAAYFNETTESWSLMQSFRWSKTKGKGANDMVAELFAMELPFFDKNEDLIDELLYSVMRSEDAERTKIKEAIRFIKVSAMNIFCYEYSGLQYYFLNNILTNVDLRWKNVNSILRMKEEIVAELPDLDLHFDFEIDWSEFRNSTSVKIKFRNFDSAFVLFSENENNDSRVWNFHFKNSETITASIKQLRSATPMEEILFRLNILLLLQDVPMPKYDELPNISNVFEYENGLFEVVRLIDYADLYSEGKALEHCVASYDSACLQGYCSIWSLRKKNIEGQIIRLATIELNNQYKINQAKGFENKEPTIEEMEIIQQWEKDVLDMLDKNEDFLTVQIAECEL